MKKMNKKGFTIVELTIVIAVIAILAAVLIPTFSSVVKNANESAALQELTAAYKEAYAKALADGKIAAGGDVVTVSNFKFKFTESNGEVTPSVISYPGGFGYTGTFEDGAWVLNTAGTTTSSSTETG